VEPFLLVGSPTAATVANSCPRMAHREIEALLSPRPACSNETDTCRRFVSGRNCQSWRPVLFATLGVASLAVVAMGRLSLGHNGRSNIQTLPAAASQPEVAAGSEVFGMQQKWVYDQFAPSVDDKREDCKMILEDMDLAGGIPAAEVHSVGSAHMCCAVCSGFANCSAWTWGKEHSVAYVTQVCWLKMADPSNPWKKNYKKGLVSGMPARGVRKQGVALVPASRSEKMDGVEAREVPATSTSAKCLGDLHIEGHGNLAVISAGANVPGMEAKTVEVVEGNLLVPHMGGRVYLANSCSDGPYNNKEYASINMLGKVMSWTVDVSGTGCGCNTAVYLVSMPQNNNRSKCDDYYCDAMSVCGVPCGEIDLQEANMFSWMSTLHAYSPKLKLADGLGTAIGYGGSLGEPPRRDFTDTDYGPGAECIDTSKPFNVAVSFPVNDDGGLAAMTMIQTQGNCSLKASVEKYRKLKHADPMAEITDMLKAGMTPTISYWSSNDMLWMDGLGKDGRGPCVKDTMEACPAYTRLYGFSIKDIVNAN